MRGGIHQIIRRCCAHNLVHGVLGGLVILTVQPGNAEEGYGDDHCRTKNPPEQSIVVSTDRMHPGESNIAMATDKNRESLEPIANVLQHTPDLAKPELAEPIPNLANPIAPKKGADNTSEKASKKNEQAQSEVISFEGVTPGISHRRDVFRAWGDPRSEETTAKTLEYRFDKFQAVEVSFDGDIVDAILVRLEKSIPLDVLVSRLNLDDILPADLTVDQGHVLAQAFPERGVLLRFTDKIESEELSENSQKSLRVDEIIIQPIKATSFILRAENEINLNPSQSQKDLKAALQLDHTSAHACWLLAEIEMRRGKAVAAERYAAEATELEPENLAFRLQWARCLRQLAFYDRAVEETRRILESPSLEPLLHAEALYEMGMLASLSSKKVALSAIPLHQKSIEIATELAANPNSQIGRAASQLLVEVHLAMAVEIAHGALDKKMEAVPRWIERASALAEGIIAEEESQLHLRLKVAVSALAAAASLDKPIDPLLWIEEAEQTAKLMRKFTRDPILRDQINWKLGLAYFQAAQIEHRRSAPESALRLGKLADAKLIDLAKQRDELPDTAYLMGRLYFQMGAVHAVHENDHNLACEWYDQAVDRLLNPVPVTTMATPQQHGDALVSMGVSYWETGHRMQAIEVTKSGVKLIEQAVKSGLLTSETLVIPYNNLAAMYRAEGETEPATKYTQLAQKISSTQH